MAEARLAQGSKTLAKQPGTREHSGRLPSVPLMCVVLSCGRSALAGSKLDTAAKRGELQQKHT